MVLDVMRGRGAFRCGCGARIKIEQPAEQRDTCVAVVNDRRCRQSPNSPSSVPLCPEHLDDIKVSVGLIRPEQVDEYTDLLAAAQYGLIHYEGEPGFDKQGFLTRLAARRAAENKRKFAEAPQVDDATVELLAEPSSVVYFIRMGDLIKIGTTTNLRRRVMGLSLTMKHVLATVRGGWVVERELHERFAHLREHGEWFRAEPELLRFIEEAKVSGHLPARRGA